MRQWLVVVRPRRSWCCRHSPRLPPTASASACDMQLARQARLESGASMGGGNGACSEHSRTRGPAAAPCPDCPQARWSVAGDSPAPDIRPRVHSPKAPDPWWEGPPLPARASPAAAACGARRAALPDALCTVRVRGRKGGGGLLRPRLARGAFGLRWPAAVCAATPPPRPAMEATGSCTRGSQPATCVSRGPGRVWLRAWWPRGVPDTGPGNKLLQRQAR